SVSVPEGTSTSAVVYTAAATDVRGGAVSFSLSGADAGAFTIDNATGAVTFNASPDFEVKSSYSFDVVASDGTLTSAQAVTLTVTDVAPSITSATSVSVAEGTSASTVVYTAAANDVQGGAVTFSLTGADAAAFTIDNATGAVTFNASPDFETQSSYTFNVVASDGTLTSAQAVTVAVTDVAPSITSATSISVAEGASTSTVVYTAAANDVQGGGVSFSLSGADAAAFSIDNATGAVTFNASPDFETKSSYTFDVVASDGTLTSSQAVTLSVTDVAPSITSATSVSVPEGTASSTVVYTAAATDVQGGGVTFSLSGADAAAFTIDNSTGAVTFNASPDFETKSSYTFNVVASDGTLSSAQAVTVAVTDVAPAITSATSVTVPEGTSPATVVYTAAATDVRGGGVTFSLSGADAGAFTIDNSTGAVSFNVSPDFETQTSYTFNVVASDGTLTSSQAVTVSVTDVAPSITSATSVSVPEGTSSATVVYTAAANDVQGGAVSFSLSGADAAAFTIDNSTGAVTFNASPDFETKSSYSFNVVASDGTLTSAQAVTVAVTDVNEAPAGADRTVGTNENTAYVFAAADFGFGDPDAGDSMSAVRIDAIPVAGSLTLAGFGPVTAGQVVSRADIDAGNLQFTPATNASGAGYASLSFSVRDAALFDLAPNTVTIDVGWVNHAPTITSSTSVTVGEGTSSSTVVYTGTATDLDAGDIITWSLTGADAGAFTIDNATGAVTFNSSPDFETQSSYSINVVASDGTVTSTQAVTVGISDVAPGNTSATSVSVPEGTGTSTVVYTAAATDVRGGAVSFSLTGADAGAFTIDSATGAVTFNASPDFETQSSYSFSVVASDGTLTSSQAVTIAVTDVAPAITSSTSVSVPEGSSTSTVVYTAAATDVQGGAVSFTLTGADAGAFAIDNATGAVTFNASPDFETKSSYSFNVVANDGTLTSSQ
ncbi:MAG: hypothetical protein QOI10_4512, partial [Solirubrobacterales bacterium]|nr:hypothetical protein [Solirubrobacterales bacterium]